MGVDAALASLTRSLSPAHPEAVLTPRATLRAVFSQVRPVPASAATAGQRFLPGIPLIYPGAEAWLRLHFGPWAVMATVNHHLP